MAAPGVQALKNAEPLPKKTITYRLINVISECRAQGEFGRGQYSAKDSEFEFLADGSIVIMMRSTAGAAKRKFVRYTAGQWFGEGDQVTEPAG